MYNVKTRITGKVETQLRHHFIYAFLLAPFFFSPATAQGVFIPREQHAFAVQPGVLLNDSAIGFATGIGFSFRGMLDLGFSVGKVNFRDPDFEENISATAFGPSVILSPVKSKLVTVSAVIAYEKASFFDEPMQSGIRLDHQNTLIVGGVIYHSKIRDKKVSVIPYIGFSYAFIELVSENSRGRVIDENGQTKFASFGFLLGFRHKSQNRIIIGAELIAPEPFEGSHDPELTVAISVGYLWSWSGRPLGGG